MLQQLGPRDLAWLAGVGRGCAAAVAATALMQWANRAKLNPPGYLGFNILPLCVREACSYAARGGNREVLEWLHDTGCPWGVVTTFAAAAGGHLVMLKWLHYHGCLWNAETLYPRR